MAKQTKARKDQARKLPTIHASSGKNISDMIS